MNRWLVFVPEVNPRTFVFFYFKGGSGRSWSVRDYLGPAPSVRYARDFPSSWTPKVILDMAHRQGCFAVPAPTVDTNDIGFWRRQIEELNRKHLGIEPAPATAAASHPMPVPQFPILDLHLLLGLPKAGKREDMRRMLGSPRSEDYVTWNVARFLERAPAAGWWPALLGLAEAQAGRQRLDAGDLPALRLWHLVHSPGRYEQASRERLLHSENPEWQARARQAEPVEGTSEIDLTLSGTGYLIFVEAKLDSDISLHTTYDPGRNQILRTIDCLLEEAGDRTPRFWMLVKDRHPTRAYMQLLADYRQQPQAVRALLPHRSLSQIEDVIRSAAAITWAEVIDLLPPHPAGSTERAVLDEVRRRLEAQPPEAGR
ncbi:MAG: hypothetical protein JW785_09035 [Acidimicrobiia bacterium]|nr:hypothetical protein [Acidimicrobiia bacterium]